VSRSLYISILLPINGYRDSGIYDESDVAPLRNWSYNTNLDDKYFRKIRVRYRYSSFDDIKNFVVEKYNLGNINNCSLRSYYDGSRTFVTEEGDSYDISAEEVKALERGYIHEGVFCKEYKSFSVDVCLYNIISRLIPDEPRVITPQLINEAEELVGESFGGDETETLEDFFDYYGGHEGRLIASMFIAQEIAKRKGGIAVMEFD